MNNAPEKPAAASGADKPAARKGLLAISPLILFVVAYIGLSLAAGDISRVPISVVFLLASIYAVGITPGLSLADRVRVYGRGAGATKVMFMIWIFLLAGAFASTASAMGCISQTVNIILKLLPSNMIYVSLFVAGCFISMATGSGMGSIAALAPIALGVAQQTGSSIPFISALVVCGAMFGDNLSFISDTTIIATTTQGCELKDKFRANLRIVALPFIAMLVIYVFSGRGMASPEITEAISWWKILPYLVVLALAICGVDVLITLLAGTVVAGVQGLVTGSFDLTGWINAIGGGLDGMSSLVLIVLMASGLMALIQHNGGIDYLVNVCTKFVRGRKSAEACIALLSGLMCAFTANNTIAIMSCSTVVKNLADRYGVDPRRAASLLDISSCIILEVIPYSAHLLCCAALTGISAAGMIPFMYYPFLLAAALVVSILVSRTPAAAAASKRGK